MKKSILFFIVLFITLGAQAGTLKKIKVKSNTTVTFKYKKDSVDLPHKENTALLSAFVKFYEAVNDSNFVGYQQMLSTATMKRIRPEKLDRKFKKFRNYAVHLMGKVKIRSIRKYEEKGAEMEPFPMYVCILQLPPGQSISHRVGFDPLKRQKFSGIENHVALHMVKEENGYRAVILF